DFLAEHGRAVRLEPFDAEHELRFPERHLLRALGGLRGERVAAGLAGIEGLGERVPRLLLLLRGRRRLLLQLEDVLEELVVLHVVDAVERVAAHAGRTDVAARAATRSEHDEDHPSEERPMIHGDAPLCARRRRTGKSPVTRPLSARVTARWRCTRCGPRASE